MKKILFALLLLLSANAAMSQERISVQAPNVVAADEQFNVVFSIDGEHAPSDFSWDAGSDFQIVWGPQKGSSSSISIINGKTTRSSTVSYTYILLPRKSGTLILPQASATVKGERIVSREVTVQVVSGGSQPGRQQSASSLQQQTPSGDVPSEDIFMRMSLSRSSVVVGEPITATLKLYQRANISGFEGAKFPTFTGFWSQETVSPTNIEFQRESIDERIYNSAVIRSWVIIPQQTGSLTIDPAELVCLVNVRTSPVGHSIFDSFFQDDYRTIRKRVVSEERTVRVSALPSGAPSSFCGGVGQFSMEARLSRDSLSAHEASSLLVTVKGQGNLSLLEAPKVSFPPDFEVYDVKTSGSADKSSGGTVGSRTFEYPFIPRSHGDFEIPPVQFSYFDSGSRRWVTLTSDPLAVRVSRGSDSSATISQEDGQVVPAVVRKDVRNLGSDIRYIVTKTPALEDALPAFVFSPLFFVVLVVLAAAFAAVWLVAVKLGRRRADVVGNRKRGASKVARKRLAQAKSFLDGDLYTAYYEALHKALLGFVSDKMNIASSDLSKENIREALVSRCVDGAHADEFLSLVEACEFARYSPSSGHGQMDDHYRKAMEVISYIDSNMKNTSGSAPVALIAVLLLSLSLTAPAHASSERDSMSRDSLWMSGVQAYENGCWSDALLDWQKIESSGVRSAEVYYNIGNAFFKMDDYGHAILYYERALKSDPSFADARHNLDFAGEFIQDKIESVPEFFLTTWLHDAGRSLRGNVWCLLFFILLAAALALLLLFILGSRPSGRKAGFFGALACLAVSVVCLFFASSQRSELLGTDRAVIVRPVCAVKSAPGAESSKDLFILHEGTRVTLVEEAGSWVNIELADGRQGWVSTADLEEI